MTMCELVIFGVTCGAQRYDRTVTLLLLNTARAHQIQNSLVGWCLFTFLHTARAASSSLLLRLNLRLRDTASLPSMPAWVHVSSDG